MKKTIYISKKTEEQFVSAVERTDHSINGTPKTVYILKKEDGTEKTVTESTFKRWYKKVEVTIDEVTITRKGKRTRKTIKMNHAAKAENIAEGSFLPFYPRPNMEINKISIDTAKSLFGDFTIDYAKGIFNGLDFTRRAYVNIDTGNVGIRYQKVLYEIEDCKAYC